VFGQQKTKAYELNGYMVKDRFLCARYEGLLRSGSTVPLILNRGTRWKEVVNFTPQLLKPGERARDVSEQEAWGPQSPSGCLSKDRNPLFLPGIKLVT
jgi:hypothetical protein